MPPAEHALLAACRTLFGEQVSLGPAFLDYLQPSGAKAAFRTQVKQHHPDRFSGAPREIRLRQTERFRDIHQAYSLLSNFLASRQFQTRPAAEPAERVRPKTTRPDAGRAPLPPPLRLEFGLFAYYSGRVDYRELIEALVWQRRQRPAIGALACQWGWLSADKVERILAQRGGGRFGRKAVGLGLLTPHQVDALLNHQRTRQLRLGRYFIDRGLMTVAETDRLAQELARHNARFIDRNR